MTARIVDPSNTAGVRMRNLPEHLHTAGVRVIDIENFDVTACGGTHVTRTGEIGIIKVLRLEKRGDKTRVEFRCGKRALLDYRLKNALIYQLTAAFTCGMEELPQSVQRLQDNLKSLQSDLKSASQQLLDYEASRLLAEATEHNGIRIVKLVFEQRDAGEIRLLASRLAQSPGTIALMGTSGERANLVFARATDLPDDMNALLKQTLAQIENGRGGGQLTMAQGSGNATTQELQVALDEATKTIEANHST